MVVTVTVNPCIDKTLSVKGFGVEKVNRATVVSTDAAGKGINVARALRLLGGSVTCTGFDFCLENGAVRSSEIAPSLASQGIKWDAVAVEGRVRTCTKIFDTETKHTVEVNEYGCAVSESDCAALLDKIGALAAECDIMTLSGSLATNMGADFYRLCVKRIKEQNRDCRVIVDAEGEPLLCALEASPFMIKPNIDELVSTFGCAERDLDSVRRAAREIIAKYSVSVVCVSFGKDGAYIIHGDEEYFCPPYKVDAKASQGAGDSMIAGICYGMQNGFTLQSTIALASAVAAAAVSKEGTGFCTMEEIETVLAQGVTPIRL